MCVVQSNMHTHKRQLSAYSLLLLDAELCNALLQQVCALEAPRTAEGSTLILFAGPQAAYHKAALAEQLEACQTGYG